MTFCTKIKLVQHQLAICGSWGEDFCLGGGGVLRGGGGGEGDSSSSSSSIWPPSTS